MEVGSAYYLDRRKPHSAVNGGDTERVHLVVDCIANAETVDLLRQATPRYPRAPHDDGGRTLRPSAHAHSGTNRRECLKARESRYIAGYPPSDRSGPLPAKGLHGPDWGSQSPLHRTQEVAGPSPR
jgi:hypothetical protein